MILIPKCPKCGSRDLIFMPWLGMIYECRRCHYRGALVIEKKKASKI